MNKLKNLSISIVLLSCFAVTNKIGAMNQYGDAARDAIDPIDMITGIETFYNSLSAVEMLEFEEELKKEIDKEHLNLEMMTRGEMAKEEKTKIGQKLQILLRNGKLLDTTIKFSEKRSPMQVTRILDPMYQLRFITDEEEINAKRRVTLDVAEISTDGVKEEDLKGIFAAIATGILSPEDLKILIKSGLDKYINYKIKLNANQESLTLLKWAIYHKLHFDIGKNVFEKIIKILVYSGAKIDNEDSDAGFYLPLRPFMIEEKEKQDKAEKEKTKMSKNLLEPSKKRLSDVKIYF
jgi:hypothetical protein